jgi:hypothetical protein
MSNLTANSRFHQRRDVVGQGFPSFHGLAVDVHPQPADGEQRDDSTWEIVGVDRREGLEHSYQGET